MDQNTPPPQPPSQPPHVAGDYSIFAILAFVCGFFIWPLALVFGILALREIHQRPEKRGKALAWIGILLMPILHLIGLILGIGALVGLAFLLPFGR